MNDVQWNGKYSMEDFVAEFSRGFPVLTKALTGTCGYDEIHVISKDEMHWIRGLKTQKRIVAYHKKSNKFLSLPLRYPVPFELHINQDTPSKEIHPGRTLGEIFDKIDLGSGDRYFIRAVQNEKLFFQVGSDAGNKARFGLMEVVDAYDEKYLIGHPVCNNKIHSNIFAYPVYMKFDLTVATSFSNHTQESFDKWFSLIDDIATTFSEIDIKMCEEIIIFNKCPQNCAYEYIDPKSSTMYEKSMMAALKDYSIKEISNIASKSARRDNSSSHGFWKHQAIRSVDLPRIPRRAPPSPASNKPQIAHHPSKKIPTKLQPRKNSDRHKNAYEHLTMEKPPDSIYTGFTMENELIPGEEDNFSNRNNHKNLIHLEPDSGDAFEKGRSGEEQSTIQAVCRPSFACSSLPEFPSDFGTFRMKDVQGCLEFLKLDKHCKIFDEMQVDGELLLSMDENILVSECSFSKFEAMKLIKFAKDGWRPTP